MQMADLGGIRLHFDDRGPKGAPAVVFANALGTDFRLWDSLLPHLPGGLRLIRYDMRGHGLTSAPEPPYFMGDLVGDAARLMDHLGARDAVFVGLSIGGIVGQGVAAERLDLVRGLVISNSAARIGNRALWDERIKAVRAGGVEALADGTMERWFARATRNDRPGLVEAFRNMLTRTPQDGYIGCMEAIAETDLYDSTARLKLPVLGIAASEDGSTPPDMVRETVDLVAGSRFHLIRGAGHLPCVERPEAYAAALTGFLQEIGHI